MRPTTKIWQVPRTYMSPASSYPLIKKRRAALRRIRYKRGLYPMHGVRGYSHYELRHPTNVTGLDIDGRTWMVDDPLHWEGIRELAERARPGRVLCAGLGLGLIVHALLCRSDITEVVVVEREADVIRLVRPLLPKDDRVGLVRMDFWRYFRWSLKVGRCPYSTMILDLWVGDGPKLWESEVSQAFNLVEAVYPEDKALTLWFGFQGWVDRLRSLRRVGEMYRQLRPEQIKWLETPPELRRPPLP